MSSAGLSRYKSRFLDYGIFIWPFLWLLYCRICYGKMSALKIIVPQANESPGR